MKMLTESFEERLKWIDPNYYERSSDLIVVEETKKAVRQRYTVQLATM